jgi:hypothetical protein
MFLISEKSLLESFYANEWVGKIHNLQSWKKHNFDVAIGVNNDVVSFLSGSKSICNLERGITRTRRPPTTIAFFDGEHL